MFHETTCSYLDVTPLFCFLLLFRFQCLMYVFCTITTFLLSISISPVDDWTLFPCSEMLSPLDIKDNNEGEVRKYIFLLVHLPYLLLIFSITSILLSLFKENLDSSGDDTDAEDLEVRGLILMSSKASLI